MFEQVGDFSSFWTRVRAGCSSFVFVSFFGFFLVGFFGVVFVGSAYVKGFVRSYYFLQLVVLMSILFAYSLVLRGESAFW